tara:strand:+ start:498 stop:1085 length:588 start_codon:yes stop_codon:yes gene_type:complete
MLQGLIPLIRRGIQANDAKSALVSLVESYEEQDIREQGQNAGPMVVFFQVDGGGTGNPAPWCAYFVSSCLRTMSRCGFAVRNPGRTGRAVALWQKAEPSQRIEREDIFKHKDPRGLVFVRTRISRGITDRQRARQGAKVQGHTGIVTHVEGSTVYAIAGNSSGGGHSNTTGAVACEVIVRDSPQWDRLVGFVEVV